MLPGLGEEIGDAASDKGQWGCFGCPSAPSGARLGGSGRDQLVPVQVNASR